MVLRLAHRYLVSQIRCSACPPPPLRRLLQCRPIPRTTIPAMNRPSIPVGDNLINMIRGFNANRSEMNAAVVESGRITAAEVKKVRRATEMETVKSRSQISRSKFACISGDLSSTEENAVAISGSLDECGFVVAFGNLVVVLPGEVVRITGKAFPPPAATSREQTAKELTEMEAKKAEIDKKAIAGVRHELWCGLGLVAAQTLWLMRLTFWELSWDVMEPICFFLASAYFMAGYVFFLRTSKEPTFQGFFECRFAAKQRRMMRDFGFDLIRFNELKAGGDGGEEACSWRRPAKL